LAYGFYGGIGYITINVKMEEYKLGKCIRIVREDSIFKIKDWKIDDVKDIKEIDGREKRTFFLKSKKTKRPIQVDKVWLDRNTEIVRCK